MSWWKKESVSSSQDEQIIAMSEVIANLKKEKERETERANRYWTQILDLKKQLESKGGISHNPIGIIPPRDRGISCKIISDDEYISIYADQPEGFTVSYNREFNKAKSNYNWVNEGEPIIKVFYDDFKFLPAYTIKSPTSGIFESVNNKVVNKGDLLCKIKIISAELRLQTIEELERAEIKKAVLQKERKKMIERETLDELIAEGKVFNVITAKNGNRMKIPQDVANAVWNRDGGCCCICGSRAELEFDHIIPISKGGATTFRNLQILCRSCNSKKSDNI